MMKKQTYGCLVGLIMVLAACSTGKKNLGAYLQTNELVFSGETEKLPARVTPYTSMARAAKYNADTAVKNIIDRIYDEDEEAEVTVDKLFNADMHEDKLYNALRALDFANVYAMSVLTDNKRYIENNLYAKSAQNLSSAAIRLHRLEILSESQIKEINRLSAQQEKIFKGLKQKYEREGYLTESEITYRKGLEVALNRLEKLKSELLFDHAEYMKLIQSSDESIKLEGKRFYELEDWDKRYTYDLFADAAVGNRREFALAKEELGSFNATKARRKAYVDYPPIARLDINGLTIDDNRYEQALLAKAENVAANLLKALRNYQSSPSNELVKQRAFDELGAVVMTQVEISYHLVEKASYAYDANRYQISDLKAQIKELEKKKSLPDYEKVELLNMKVKLLQLEYDSANFIALRAAALRGLYYYAGLSPFDKSVLKEPIKEIEVILKKSFNQDIVVLLENAQKQEKWDDGGNSWAHQDNWLDKLIDQPQGGSDYAEEDRVVVPSKKQVATKPVVAESAPKPLNVEGKTIIQLGAYSDVENAYDDKKEILAAMSSLAQYDIYIEDAVVNGVTYHRMMFKPEPEKLQSLCNEIMAAGFDCMLR